VNLHGIISGAIGTINPFVSATVKRSSGYSLAPGGIQTPAYTTFSISCQVQALSYTDITQLDGLSIQGVRRKIYLTGNVEGIVRADRRGGDLIIFPNGTLPEGNTWLAALALESWPDWVSIAITLQTGN
jgi:hypothetical protein